MNRIRVCVAGATGSVGRALIPVITEAPDLELVGAVSRRFAGLRLGEAIGLSEVDVSVSSTVADALRAETDVLIDYTAPDVVKENVLTAIKAGAHVVIGTSGLSDEDYEEIDARARTARVGIVAAGNFSITAALLLRFSLIAASYIDEWEILEYAHPDKRDAPSGTARELAHRLSAVRAPRVDYPVSETHGLQESRGATLRNSQIHSIRLSSFATSVEIIFGVPGLRLTLRHDSESGAAPYLSGTLLATRKVGSSVGLVRGFDRLLEL